MAERPWTIAWNETHIELSETHVVGDGDTDFYVQGSMNGHNRIFLQLDKLTSGIRHGVGGLDNQLRDGFSVSIKMLAYLDWRTFVTASCGEIGSRIPLNL